MAGIKDVINTLDDASEVFDKVVAKSQMKIYEEAITLMKSLELDGQGKVKQTIANLKLLVSIKSKLAAVSNNKEYLAGVGKFLQYFDELQKQQNAYFSANFPQATLGEQAKKRHEAMKQIAVQNVIEALTGDGLKANVTDKVNDILLRAVTTGAKFSNLQEELRAHLIGVDGGTGALSRYATTYATTAISQFTGQNNKLLTQDLGVKWFMYTGSTKETTREFCEHLVKKRYIHHSEIHKILQGDIDGHQCAIYAKTGLPFGMIEGTNEDNFQVNCGGWNCRHQLVPVSELAVPQELRDKFPDEKPVVETKPEPIPESAYKADLDVFTEYLSKHKSGKVADDVAAMYAAAEAGDQAKLDSLIADAKAVIAKNEASIKSKLALKGKAKKSELQSAIDKYKDYLWFDIDAAKKLIKDGDSASIDDFIGEIGEKLMHIEIEYENIPDAIEVSKHLTDDQMIILDDKISDIDIKLAAIKNDYNAAIEYLLQCQLSASNDYTCNIYLNYAQKKLDEIYTENAKKKIGHVKEYAESHPKSGKVIGLYEDASKAIASGDYALALAKIDEADAVIDKNEKSNAQKAAKKAAEKEGKSAVDVSGLEYIPNAKDEIKTHTIEELKLVNEQVANKLKQLEGTSLEYQKKKLTFEIVDYFKGNMNGVQQKYPNTWELAMHAYEEELKKVEEKIALQSLQSAVNMQKQWFMENPTCVEVGKLLADIDKLNSASAIQERLKKIADEVDKFEEKQFESINEGKYISGKLFTDGNPYDEEEIKELNKRQIAVEKAIKSGRTNGQAFEDYAAYVVSLSKKYCGKQTSAISNALIKKGQKQYGKYIIENPSNPETESNPYGIWQSSIGGVYHSYDVDLDDLNAYIARFNLSDVTPEELSLIVRFTNGMTFYNAYNLRATSKYYKDKWESKMQGLKPEEIKDQERIIKEYTDALDAILSKLPRYTGVVYRGLRDVGAVEVLKIIKDAWDNGSKIWVNTAAALSSWELQQALNFDGGPNALILKIHNKTGAYIRDVSEYNYEKEVMLIRNKKYKILKEPYTFKGRTWVELEEIV